MVTPIRSGNKCESLGWSDSDARSSLLAVVQFIETGDVFLHCFVLFYLLRCLFAERKLGGKRGDVGKGDMRGGNRIKVGESHITSTA